MTAGAVAIDWTAVGDPGNPADASGYGAVASTYLIATTEVTNVQYAEFLNAVASAANLLDGADPNGLYSTQMNDSAQGGITRTGDANLFGYSYTVKDGFADKPVNFTSFWDAARFANWLENGQPTGAQDATTTEDGAYTLSSAAISNNTVTRNADARIFLPSEDEWYKAAYYDALATSYFAFPTAANAAPSCTAPTAAANSANCDAPGTDASDPDVDGLVGVRSFTGSASRYGTYDQGGNVWEWNEAIIGGAFRGVRGGSGDSADNALDSATRASTVPTAENPFFGFRVAMVPEPDTGLLLLVGLVAVACRRRRSARIPAALAAAAVLIAGAPLSATAQLADAGCDVVAKGAPLTPAQRARMIELRRKFFGSAHVDAITGAVDPAYAIASWITVTGYAFALNGHVILLDAYIGDDSGYVPTHDCELSGLRPEFVLIGHGHYDHADLAPSVLNRNRGAVFIGAAEHCVDVTAALDGLTVPRCIESMPREAPMGTIVQLPPVIPGVAITAIRHPHSDAQPPDPNDPSPLVLDPAEPKPLDFGPCRFMCPPPRPNFVEPNMVEDGAISVLYQFRLGSFALTWNNTNGPSHASDPAILAMRTLPQTDVELGSILGFNNPTNGFHDARVIAEALRARLVVPGHHDFLLPYSGSAYQTAFRTEMQETPAASRPGILWVDDPDDYIRPELLTWRVSDPIWAGSAPLLP